MFTLSVQIPWSLGVKSTARSIPVLEDAPLDVSPKRVHQLVSEPSILGGERRLESQQLIAQLKEIENSLRDFHREQKAHWQEWKAELGEWKKIYHDLSLAKEDLLTETADANSGIRESLAREKDLLSEATQQQLEASSATPDTEYCSEFCEEGDTITELQSLKQVSPIRDYLPFPNSQQLKRVGSLPTARQNASARKLDMILPISAYHCVSLSWLLIWDPKPNVKMKLYEGVDGHSQWLLGCKEFNISHAGGNYRKFSLQICLDAKAGGGEIDQVKGRELELNKLEGTEFLPTDRQNVSVRELAVTLNVVRNLMRLLVRFPKPLVKIKFVAQHDEEMGGEGNMQRAAAKAGEVRIHVVELEELGWLFDGDCDVSGIDTISEEVSGELKEMRHGEFSLMILMLLVEQKREYTLWMSGVSVRKTCHLSNAVWWLWTRVRKPTVKMKHGRLGTMISSAIDATVNRDTEVVYLEKSDSECSKTNHFDYVIVAVRKHHYTETAGDNDTLTMADIGSDTIKNICRAVKCVVIIIFGRPMVMEQNLSGTEAPVAGWVPVDEGLGVIAVHEGYYNTRMEIGGLGHVNMCEKAVALVIAEVIKVPMATRSKFLTSLANRVFDGGGFGRTIYIDAILEDALLTATPNLKCSLCENAIWESMVDASWEFSDESMVGEGVSIRSRENVLEILGRELSKSKRFMLQFDTDGEGGWSANMKDTSDAWSGSNWVLQTLIIPATTDSTYRSLEWLLIWGSMPWVKMRLEKDDSIRSPLWVPFSSAYVPCFPADSNVEAVDILLRDCEAKLEWPTWLQIQLVMQWLAHWVYIHYWASLGSSSSKSKLFLRASSRTMNLKGDGLLQYISRRGITASCLIEDAMSASVPRQLGCASSAKTEKRRIWKKRQLGG